MKLKYDHCQLCKTKNNLHINSSRINMKGEVQYSYLCRDCQSERARKYRQTQRGKDVYREIMRRQYVKNHTKVLARVSLNMALRRKKNPIIKPDRCEVCNEIKKLDAHHEDYSKRLEVKWICRQCHFKI